MTILPVPTLAPVPTQVPVIQSIKLRNVLNSVCRRKRRGEENIKMTDAYKKLFKD